MKIAFISQHLDAVLPNRQNSVGIWTYQAALRLAKKHEVLVIARRARGAPVRMSHGGIGFEFVRCTPARVWAALAGARAWLRPNAAPLFAQTYYQRGYVVRCIRHLRALNPDVIHLHNFFNHLPAYRDAFPHSILVLHMHCNWLSELDHIRTERCLRAADVIVGCSDHIVRGARDRFPDLPVRFAEVPNGVGIVEDRQSQTCGGETVLFVGRVSPEKGVHVLLEAWRKVRASRPTARLEIVGPMAVCPRELLVDLSTDPDVRALSRFYADGNSEHVSYEQILRAMISPDMADSVSFAEFEPHERVLQRYAGAALLANPSLSEAFGMSLVEALAFGTPVVACRVGGMVEIVESTGGGILVDKADPDALAGAILRLLGDTSLRERLGQQGREKVSSLYSWDSVVEQALVLYEESTPDRYACRL